MSDPVAPRRFTFEGTTYQLRRWAWEDGRTWSDRLARVVAQAAAGAKDGTDTKTIAKLMDALEQPFLDELWRVCVRYTDVVGRSADGRETLVALESCEAAHMLGRYADYLKLRIEHVRVEFGPFFGVLRTSVKSLVGEAAS